MADREGHRAFERVLPSVSQILEMEFIVKFRLARLNSILNHRINLKLSEVFYMIKLPPLAARIMPENSVWTQPLRTVSPLISGQWGSW